MVRIDLRKWLPGPELIAKMLGGELAEYGMLEELE